MDYLVYAALAISVTINLFLAYRFYKKHHVLTIDAKALLSEIMTGSAIVKIQVIDPAGMMYRSPRG